MSQKPSQQRLVSEDEMRAIDWTRNHVLTLSSLLACDTKSQFDKMTFDEKTSTCRICAEIDTEDDSVRGNRSCGTKISKADAKYMLVATLRKAIDVLETGKL